MKTTTTIRVNLKRFEDDSYDIRIGVSLREAARAIARRYPHSSKFVITDSHVEWLYAQQFLGDLAGSSHLLVVPAGEKSKSFSTKNRIDEAILKMNPRRDSLIIALGGGMIGDLAGFIAATLLRGVRFIQVPTTLLAQVDSSIGGKVGINLTAGKNLVGAFHQPVSVFIDPQTLRTLSEREFANGMAEVIKYAAILDKRLFTYLEKNIAHIDRRKPEQLNLVITRCCELKRLIVQKDEKESGLRRILNFGHTVGHAVESLSRYRIAHGEAVAIGMVAESGIAVRLGLLSQREHERLERLILAYHLPITIPKGVTPEKIAAFTLRDKKARGNSVDYTLLSAIGKGREGVSLGHAQALKLLAQ